MRVSLALGEKLPPETVLVDSTTLMRNPYAVFFHRYSDSPYETSVKDIYEVRNRDTGQTERFFDKRVDALESCVRLFEVWVLPDLMLKYPSWFVSNAGKAVACTCPEGEPCHGDVLEKELSRG